MINVIWKVWSKKCKTKSVKQKVWNKKFNMKSVDRKVWYEKCGMKSVERKVWYEKCDTKSVIQKVWNDKFGMTSVEWSVEQKVWYEKRWQKRGSRSVEVGVCAIPKLNLRMFRNFLLFRLKTRLYSFDETTYNQNMLAYKSILSLLFIYWTL